jgi:hypothetical protein
MLKIGVWPLLMEKRSARRLRALFYYDLRRQARRAHSAPMVDAKTGLATTGHCQGAP